MTTETGFKVGQIVAFQGYAELTDGQAELLQAGDLLRIAEIKDQEGNINHICFALERKNDKGEPIGEALWEDEIEATGKPEHEAPVEAPKKGRKTKAKAEVKAEVKTEEPVAKATAKTKAAAKTPAKAKAKAKAKAPAKIKAIPKKEVEPVVFNDTEAVTTILGEHKDAVEAARALVLQGRHLDFTLGGVLTHIHAEKIHVDMGYQDNHAGFSDFIAAELSTHYRKGMELINLYRVFTSHGLDESFIGTIGWSKAVSIARLERLKDGDGNNTGAGLLDKNFDKLVKFALKHTRDDLDAKIRNDFMDATSSERIAFTKFNFKLVGAAADIGKRAVAVAKSQGVDVNDNDAFEVICGEYLTMAEGTEMSLEESIAVLEAKYGVILIEEEPVAAEEASEAA